jgi:hypothetical protein
MRETSGKPLFRNLRLLTLEGRHKGLQLLDGHSHAKIPHHLSPLRNRAVNFAQILMHRSFVRWKNPAACIECRRQSPLSMSHVQESVIIEVIIDIREARPKPASSRPSAGVAIAPTKSGPVSVHCDAASDRPNSSATEVISGAPRMPTTSMN